jgi:hypothetical protein
MDYEYYWHSRRGLSWIVFVYSMVVFPFIACALYATFADEEGVRMDIEKVGIYPEFLHFFLFSEISGNIWIQRAETMCLHVVGGYSKSGWFFLFE